MGKGASGSQATWNVDGMPLTDMSSLSSPFYYDFDMFQEMSVVTGGADPKSATGGVQMNFMLKSGTNAFHGSGKLYFEDESMQSKNLPEELFYLGSKDPVTGQPTGEGDRTEQFLDWGGEIGGPVLKDQWWFWVSYGKQDIRILKLSGTRDRTVLPNLSFKTQGQITKSMRGSFTFFQANKQKWGRNASPTRPQETTFNQDGPNSMYKGEINYNVGNNLFLVGRYAYTKGGFTFDPQGGMDKDVYRDASGVWHNSMYNYVTDRPQNAFVTDGNYFKGNHEIKFGFTWRKTEVHSTSQWPGSMISTRFDYGPGTDAVIQVTAPWASDGSSKYINFYVGDTISMKRATLNFGIRYDYQMAAVLPSSARGRARFREVPARSDGPGRGQRAHLQELAAARRHHLRARPVAQDAAARDLRHVHRPDRQRRSIVPVRGRSTGTCTTTSVWPRARRLPRLPISSAESTTSGATAALTPTTRQPRPFPLTRWATTRSPRTHEFIIGVDRELMPNLGINASYTYRTIGNFNWRPSIKTTGGVITGCRLRAVGHGHRRAPDGVRRGERRHLLHAVRRNHRQLARTGATGARSTRPAPATPRSTRDSRFPRRSGCRTSGWRGSVSRPTAGASTSTARTLDAATRRHTARPTRTSMAATS